MEHNFYIMRVARFEDGGISTQIVMEFIDGIKVTLSLDQGSLDLANFHDPIRLQARKICTEMQNDKTCDIGSTGRQNFSTGALAVSLTCSKDTCPLSIGP